MAETQLLEHFGGSALDHENGLPQGVPHVCELFLVTGVVECYRRESPAVAVESIMKICTE